MTFILPVGQLVMPNIGQYGISHIDPNRIDECQCAMLYAIGTHPEHRGRGLGEAVTRAAAEHAIRRGCPTVVLKPAEESLFDFYAGRCGFVPFFEAAETTYTAAELPAAGSDIHSVLPDEYRRLRQAFLSGGAYIDFSERALEYQTRLSEAAGGGLYALTLDGAAYGCAIVERADDAVDIKELLLRSGASAEYAAAAIAAAYPAESYRIRTVRGASAAGNNWQRFGMLYPLSELSSKLSGQSVKWYGPAFD
jgi:hypothetical protein